MGISNGSTLNVIRSTLRSNRADYGGGIAVFNNVNVRNSTLEGNTATSSGGGFYNNGQLIIVNSTISSNSTNTDGGGIYNRNSAFLYSTSVINNDADHDRDELGGIGGGVYAFATSRFVAVNTLFSGNTILDSPTPDNCNGVLEIYGMNLFDAIDGCTFSGNGGAAWDFVAGNSIGALQDNGGPTLTHALLPGSEAIDAPNIQICIDENGFPLTTDQRGAARTTGLRCDVGAFEYGSIADLMSSYKRLKDAGITPSFCLDHMMTFSMYYKDPEGNFVEFFAAAALSGKGVSRNIASRKPPPVRIYDCRFN
jgi:hypothetical protein